MELYDNTRKLSGLFRKVLSEREREIIFLRYGLVTGKEVTQREIGEMLSISRSYVSRIEKKALRKLREGFEKEN
jgi:RNA polymerase sporulation-specific sigma factor